ncbi:MAG TPA: CHAT domain-containing protein [bacterium]|nr:CHAT domain-containing protein [bacterium]
MVGGLWWSFGEPRQVNGEIVTDFYYQIGKHIELRLPWPSRTFDGAGGLPLQLDDGEKNEVRLTADLLSNRQETGRRLYELLGKEAQASLIRTFAQPGMESFERILYLHFPSPTPDSKELCLTLEDLPWELLHDGEDYITWRYSLQIIRAHSLEAFPQPAKQIEVSYWGILLVTPFVFADGERLQNLGLAALPHGKEEAWLLRTLEKQTHGLIRISPHKPKTHPGGVATLRELETLLRGGYAKHYPLLHFIGHGVIYNDEPCLCFESDKKDRIDYVSAGRLRKLFMETRDTPPPPPLPSVIFLNACSSSSRGRHSSGLASGLHDLGMCVIGYNAEIHDDKPLLVAEGFYKSLCLDQSVQNPQWNPNVVTAIGSARRRLRDLRDDPPTAWGSLRAYVPVDISFTVYGRSLVERFTQKVYSHFSQWMNPGEYTDHLSIGFQFAVLFGMLMGLGNLLFVFPESVLARHLTYQEIASEMIRIFLVGPLSFLAAAIFVAMLTYRNHQFLTLLTGSVPWSKLIRYGIQSFPMAVGSGLAFGTLFFYSFSRLDLLTAQLTSFASLARIPIAWFWYGFAGLLGLMVCWSLTVATLFSLRRKETLHSYRTFYFVFVMYVLLGGSHLYQALHGIQGNQARTISWISFVLFTILAYALTIIKILKETSWRALQKSTQNHYLSWRKLIPLMGGAMLLVFCYYLLEESVRFEPRAIQTALLARKALIEEDEAPAGPVAQGNFDQQVLFTLERALQQRAIQDIPDGILQAASRDWLLSVVSADYLIYTALRERQPGKAREWLRQSQTCLEQAAALNQEVMFKDYYRNIAAMQMILFAGSVDNPEERRKLYQDAIENATFAVRKDGRNFAYLDTLARAEFELALLDHDPDLFRKAAAHVREAELRAFFLRSPRAGEVRQSIDEMAEKIRQQMKILGKSD